MVKSYNGFYVVVLMLITNLMLTSCVSDKVDPYVVEERDAAIQKSDRPQSATQKYAAWNPEEFSKNAAGSNRAVKALLNQADVFILYNALERAAAKLERILRIEPTYAPAWSRLSWIYLQSNSPDRAIQMAQRSNSYASNSNKLKILNWSFIRQASLKMNDIEEVRRAERMIEELEGS